MKASGGDYPLGRAGQPAELASIYMQLAAEDASYTTGNIYGARGGDAKAYLGALHPRGLVAAWNGNRKG